MAIYMKSLEQIYKECFISPLIKIQWTDLTWRGVDIVEVCDRVDDATVDWLDDDDDLMTVTRLAIWMSRRNYSELRDYVRNIELTAYQGKSFSRYYDIIVLIDKIIQVIKGPKDWYTLSDVPQQISLAAYMTTDTKSSPERITYVRSILDGCNPTLTQHIRFVYYLNAPLDRYQCRWKSDHSEIRYVTNLLQLGIRPAVFKDMYILADIEPNNFTDIWNVIAKYRAPMRHMFISSELSYFYTHDLIIDQVSSSKFSSLYTYFRKTLIDETTLHQLQRQLINMSAHVTRYISADDILDYLELEDDINSDIFDQCSHNKIALPWYIWYLLLLLSANNSNIPYRLRADHLLKDIRHDHNSAHSQSTK